MNQRDAISSKTLGQISLMQSVVTQLPDKTSMLNFVARGMKDINGVDDVVYSLPETESVQLNSQGDRNTGRSFSIAFKETKYATLVFYLSNLVEFEPYLPFIENFVNMLGIIFEEQNQRELNKEIMANLEHMVSERTMELKDANNHLLDEVEQRKKIAQELEEKSFFIKRILDTTPNLIYIYDLLENRNVFTNREVTEFFGYTDSQILTMGSNIMGKIIHEDDLQSILAHHHKMKTALDNEVYEVIYRVSNANGEVKWLCSRDVVFTRAADGCVTHILGIAEDITEKKESEEIRRKLEEGLQQSQKMEAIGTLAGGIAHDFNNMLSIITGNISYALGSLNKGEELYEILSDVQKSSKQARGLTNQLLTFSKGGAPVKKVADINKIISDATTFSIRGANSKCYFELSEDLWPSEVDDGQISQVVNNLIINANQAMPNGGAITVRTENLSIEADNGIPLSAGKYIKIYIGDQGVGISKTHLSNIFDPYFTTKQKGSGLGLATTYSIIKRHGGHIAVYSELEKGTVFNIYLPASKKETVESSDQAKTEHKGKGRLLVMDDQEAILKMAGRMLNSMGYETAFAADGSQAVELYKNALLSDNLFDAVILDLTVPGGMGGSKTIIELLKIDSNVKAIVSSGYSNDPIMSNYEDYGFCGIVSKPYTKAELAEVLNKLFDKPVLLYR